MSELNGKFMVFDVESVGLHGEGFAVGFVVTDGIQILDMGLYACPVFKARGHKGNIEGREWVKKNCPEINKTHDCPRQMRTAFWNKWQLWKSHGAVLVADCAWPVEARFLAKCVDDEPSSREWAGPYPLFDLSSVLLALGINPTEKFSREELELPEHNPLSDARQSARVLMQHLRKNFPSGNVKEKL